MNETECPLETCQLLQKGCLLPYESTNLSMNAVSPFELTAMLNNSIGYNETVCVECSFGGVTHQTDNYTVVQRYDCLSETLVISPDSLELDFDDVALTHVIGDYSNFF